MTREDYAAVMLFLLRFQSAARLDLEALQDGHRYGTGYDHRMESLKQNLVFVEELIKDAGYQFHKTNGGESK